MKWLATLSILACVVLQARAQNDFIIGELTGESVLVFIGRISASNSGVVNYDSTTPLRITRIEAIDQNNGTGGVVIQVSAGLNFRRTSLYFLGVGPINFMIYIYGEPQTNNDFIFGAKTNSSILIHCDQILANFEGGAFGSLIFQGENTISRLEVLDQHNGTGGFVFDVAWFNDNTGVYVVISGAPINFTVNIYKEPIPPPANDFFLGEITNTSILMHTENVTGIVFHDLNFNAAAPFRITRIEAFDQDNSAGGELYLFSAGLGYRRVTLYFRSAYFINFLVNIYGEPQENNDFFIGEATLTSVQLHSEEIVAEVGSQSVYINYQGDDPINRVEVLDQHNGTGGYVFAATWLNDNTGVHVTFSGDPIHFIVNIYGERYTPGFPIDYSAVAHKVHFVEPQLLTLN